MPLRGGACADSHRIPSDGRYKAVRGRGRRGGRNRQRQRQRRRDWRGAGARCRRGWSGGRNVAAMSEKIDELQELFMSKRGQQIQYTIGRIMLTFTFLDDALRVFKEWGSQVDYMGGQLGPLKPIAPALLLVFIIAQVSGSVSLLLNKYVNIGAWALLGVVAGQVVLYTTLFDIHFFLRNAAVIGGLFVLVTSDDPYKAKRMLSGLMDTSACVYLLQEAEAGAQPPPLAVLLLALFDFAATMFTVPGLLCTQG